MEIGIAQIDTLAGDFQATADRVVACSEQAAARGVGLLVFPSAILTGTAPIPYVEQEDQLADLLDVFSDLGRRVKCPCLVPIVLLAEDETFSELILVADGEMMPLRFAGFARGERGVDEPSDFIGDDSWNGVCFEFGGLKFAAAFDFDGLEDLALHPHRVDVILYLPSCGYAIDDAPSALGAALSENHLLADAEDARAWLVAAGSLGCYDTCIFPGASFIASPLGELAASAPAFEESLISQEIRQDGEHLDHPLEPEVYDRSFFCWETLALGMRDFVHKLGFSDVALALDGTLASMALATLASDSLGPTHVHVLMASPLADYAVPEKLRLAQASARHEDTVPTAWSRALSAADRRDSCRHLAANLRVDVHECDEVFRVATQAALESARNDEDRIAAVRRSASLAQISLAELARQSSSVVLSSHDKTWLALEAHAEVPFAAALLPLGDTYRTNLLEMVRTRNTISPVVPDVQIALCDLPDLGLGVSQEHGYEVESLLRRMDSLLEMHVEWEHPAKDMAAQADEKDLIDLVLKRLDACAFARTSAGPVLEASSHTLEALRRPFSYAWRDHLRSRDDSSEDSLEDMLRNLAEAAQGSELKDEDIAKELNDILGYLRDFPQEMGRGAHRGGASDTQASFGSYPVDENPFSEN